MNIFKLKSNSPETSCPVAPWKRGLLAVLILLAGIATEIHAESKNRKTATEYQIKAVYLYNYLLFVHWPLPDANDLVKNAQTKDKTITIGILGKDPFGDSFSEVQGKLIKPKNKRLLVKKFGDYNAKLKFEKCQLLFICYSEKDNLKNILEHIKGLPILTVSDIDDFLENGGMIKLVKYKNKIRWEINHTQAKKVRLKLNSQLLRNATKVIEVPKIDIKSNQDKAQ